MPHSQKYCFVMNTQAWVVRAGTNGEREGRALQNGIVYAGWPGLEDLTDATNTADIRDIVSRSYPTESTHTIGSWTGQLSRFVLDFEIGDLVIMPLKNEQRDLAIGHISSNYYFTSDEDEGFRHCRDVTWAEHRIPRDALLHDLRASLGSLMTITKLDRNEAPQRLEKLFNGAPKDNYGVAGKLEDLEGISRAIANRPKKEFSLTVRDLMSVANIQRRTAGTLAQLEADLKSNNLEVIENIGEAGIDEFIRIVAASEAGSHNIADAVVSEVASGSENRPVPSSKSPQHVLGYKLSNLPSASRQPLSVAQSDPIELALTHMVQNNFSQLPVIDEGVLKGVVTWESIALAKIHRQLNQVEDALQLDPHFVHASRDVLDVVNLVNARGFIFVMGEDNSVGGIVTVQDLVEEFGRDRYPLALLEELELRLRLNLQRRCNDEDVRSSQARATKLSDVTMGNYPFLLADDTIWGKLNWIGVDRETLKESVRGCAQLRNDMMHFSPDPIEASRIALLEGTLRLVRSVTTAIPSA